MTKPNSLDILLHTISLQISLALKIAKEEFEGEVGENFQSDLIESYTNVRRHINANEDNGKRFGSTYSYNMMQKGEID